MRYIIHYYDISISVHKLQTSNLHHIYWINFHSSLDFQMGIMLLLTAWNVMQFAEFISLIWVSSVAPWPLVLVGVTAVIRCSFHTGVWKGGAITISAMTMRRLWVPSLTCQPWDGHGGCAQIASNVNVITGAFVWNTKISQYTFRCFLIVCTESS